MMKVIEERAYQIDAMGDLGDGIRKISNGQYSEAIVLIMEALETTKIIRNYGSNDCDNQKVYKD